uniref:Putative ovule protein n=1 Tax=Solanum chacoense TaxID=4108 RepID=A0A0V0GQP1_SOLCH
MIFMSFLLYKLLIVSLFVLSHVYYHVHVYAYCLILSTFHVLMHTCAYIVSLMKGLTLLPLILVAS